MTPAIEKPDAVGPTARSTMVARHWTGGQYSLFRVLLAAYVLAASAYVLARGATAFWPAGTASLPHLTEPWTAGLMALSAILALLLAVGAFDRTAALLLAAIHGWLHAGEIAALLPGDIAITFLLLVHAAMPPAPYGSWQAIGRADPKGEWRMPDQLALAVWIALMAILALSLFIGFPSAGWLAAGLVLPFLWFGRHRSMIWASGAALLTGIMLFSTLPGPVIPLVLLLLLASDPAWIPARRRPAAGVLFFDGNCALCHGAVRFLLAEDRDARFTFSPIGGERFTRSDRITRMLPEDAIASLPDSMILVTEEGQTLLKSDAVIACLHGIGGLWRCAAPVLSFLPAAVRDRLYDLIGSRRYKLFGTKAETCPLMTTEQHQRFHP